MDARARAWSPFAVVHILREWNSRRNTDDPPLCDSSLAERIDLARAVIGIGTCVTFFSGFSPDVICSSAGRCSGAHRASSAPQWRVGSRALARGVIAISGCVTSGFTPEVICSNAGRCSRPHGEGPAPQWRVGSRSRDALPWGAEHRFRSGWRNRLRQQPTSGSHADSLAFLTCRLPCDSSRVEWLRAVVSVGARRCKSIGERVGAIRPGAMIVELLAVVTSRRSAYR